MDLFQKFCLIVMIILGAAIIALIPGFIIEQGVFDGISFEGILGSILGSIVMLGLGGATILDAFVTLNKADW